MHFCLTNWKNNYWEFVGKATYMGAVLKKIQQNKEKYDDKKKINVTCAPPSSWPWYEYCDYFFIGITKINGVPKVLIKEWYALLIKRPRYIFDENDFFLNSKDFKICPKMQTRSYIWRWGSISNFWF